MSKFRKIEALLIIAELVIIIVANILVTGSQNSSVGRPYRVDIVRASKLLQEGLTPDVNEYHYITAIKPFTEEFKTNSDYVVVSAKDKLYAIEYIQEKNNNSIILMNISMAIMFVATTVILIYIDKKVLTPFHKMSNLSVELAKGNLSTPIREEKNKFFGKFLWGMDMLRDNLENNREKELQLQKEKKTLILSISHDIKTPLSAIKLYTKALEEGLYDTEEKKKEALEGISRNTVQIEKYVSEIVSASKEDFLNLEVKNTEFYLETLLDKISVHYNEKFQLLHTDFSIKNDENYLLSGDPDRLEEVIQNMLENAIKYGDGKWVKISVSQEEDCCLICVENSGSSITENEINHIFESFYRGSNSENIKGSGLGLYICKSLTRLMGGDVFAHAGDNTFSITAVIKKA